MDSLRWTICRDGDGEPYPCTDPADFLRCPFCGSRMIIHYFFVPEGDPFGHVDVQLKCPFCEYVATFGVSTYGSGERSILRNSRLHGRVLRRELERILPSGSEEYRIVEERLRRWGYW